MTESLLKIIIIKLIAAQFHKLTDTEIILVLVWSNSLTSMNIYNIFTITVTGEARDQGRPELTD